MSDLKRAIAAAAVGAPEAGPGDATARRFRFDPGFLGFAGHFPGRPVLPAVAQFLAGVLVAEDRAGGLLHLAAVERAKFHRVLGPGEEVRVECRPRGGDGALQVTVSAGGELAAAFVLRFAGGGEAP